MNNMAHKLVTWAQEQNGIFLTYSDFYSTYFSYGLIAGTGTPENVPLTYIAKNIFISNNSNSAIGILTYDNNFDQQDKNDFLDNMNNECGAIARKYGNNTIKMTMTGESALIKDMNAESRKDVEKKDTLTIPIALCVLALIIRSYGD